MNSSQVPLIRITSLVLISIFSVILLSLVYVIVAPFIEGFAWAVILVLMTWPLYQWLVNHCKIGATYSALLMTLGVTFLFLITVIPILIELGKELYSVSRNGSFRIETITVRLAEIPMVGTLLASSHFLSLLNTGIGKLGTVFLGIAGTATQLLLDGLFTIAMMLFTSFFLYRYGHERFSELQSVIFKFCGARTISFFTLAGNTVRGVVYGAFVTALAQGLLAGIGFYYAGAAVPALLGFTTVLMSFIPFGAPLVYLPVCAYLLVIQGSWFAGLCLLAWGVLVVSTVDNLLRPLFISQTIRMPILIVFVGIVGGIFSFGLIGLFIGPVVVAIAQAAWSEIVESCRSIDSRTIEN